MSTRDDSTLLDIVKAAERALEYAGTKDKSVFLADGKSQAAVVLELLIAAEAVKRLSAAFRDAHAHIPWRDIAGMRDQLIHGYDQIDLDEVWKAITTDIPKLLADLRAILLEEP